MSIINLKRKERIRMFLNEYYFGQKPIMTFMRIFMGPILFFFCYQMYIQGDTRLTIGYGLFGILFGIYYTLIPFIWVLFRWNILKDINFEIIITSDKLNIKDEFSYSEIEYSAFKKIFQRKTYFVLLLDNLTKIYLPYNKLNETEIQILNSISQS